MTRVVLASASPGRRMVLRQAGIDPLVVVSGVDEDAVIAAQGPDAAPGDVANALAAAKAEQVVGNLEAALASDCVVVGCDSMLFIDGALRGKPDSVAGARRQWESMRGRRGVLHTGHCVIRLRDGSVTHREVQSGAHHSQFRHTVRRRISTAYLASGESLRGGGRVHARRSRRLVRRRYRGRPVQCDRSFAPARCRRLLRRVGLSIAELWADNPL